MRSSRAPATGSLFRSGDPRTVVSAGGLPDFARAPSRVAVDFETNGLDYLGTSVPVGVAVAVDGASAYAPWGHTRGPNMEPDAVRAWLVDVVRGREVVMANAKFDVACAAKWGVDLERLGARPRDVLHHAALVDEYRRRYNLNAVAREYLGVGKVELPADGLAIWERDPREVDGYARRDAEITLALRGHLAGIIADEKLGAVADLEDDLIFATLEMERNGARLDVDRLEEWRTVCRSRYTSVFMALRETAGFAVHPTRRSSLTRLWESLRLPVTAFTDGGEPSFADEALQPHSHRPEIRMVRELLALDSLRSKYLDKYAAAVDSSGILRYRLHQMRAEAGEGGNNNGTVSGRYSSSGDGDEGINVQQVYKPKEQRRIPAIADMIVRDLFVADDGCDFVSSDASQIEYRVFAHLAAEMQYPDGLRLAEAYRADPRTDIHQLIADWAGIDRDTEAKHANFAKVYGAGLRKFAYMIGKGAAEAEAIWNRYNETFPAGERLLRMAADLAATRGYVCTVYGRRCRFLRKKDARSRADYEKDRRCRWHAALNRVCQGTAADLMKLKILRAYRERDRLGISLRFTVHDELVTYNRRDADPTAFSEMMGEQEIQRMRVPITWNVRRGRSWGEA